MFNVAMSRHMKVSESPAPGLRDQIYDASPEPTSPNHQHGSTCGVSMSPSPGAPNSSDKENRSTYTAADKGKGHTNMAASRLPSLSDSNSGAKRKRIGNEETSYAPSSRRRRTMESEEDEVEDEDNTGNWGDENDDDQYDPDQDIAERRRLRKGLRDLTKNLNDNRAEYLDVASTGLLDTFRKANDITSAVKQTSDATIDSRLLVTAADLSYRKTVQLTLGDSLQGVDIDEFVSNCIALMRRARNEVSDADANPVNTQSRRARTVDLDGDSEGGDGDDGDMMNWEALGEVTMQYNLRPTVPGFLLGPLSLEKRGRKPNQRKAGLKHSNLKQTQPEVLNPGDIEKAENANLTVLCTRILARLKKVEADGMSAVEEEATEDMSDEDVRALMIRHGVRSEGGVDLFKYVVNPWSFGQTVENLFYVSFLIRDGKVGVIIDEDGTPYIG